MDVQILLQVPLEYLQLPALIVVQDLMHPVIIVTNNEVSLETLVREE